MFWRVNPAQGLPAEQRVQVGSLLTQRRRGRGRRVRSGRGSRGRGSSTAPRRDQGQQPSPRSRGAPLPRGTHRPFPGRQRPYLGAGGGGAVRRGCGTPRGAEALAPGPGVSVGTGAEPGALPGLGARLAPPEAPGNSGRGFQGGGLGSWSVCARRHVGVALPLRRKPITQIRGYEGNFFFFFLSLSLVPPSHADAVRGGLIPTAASYPPQALGTMPAAGSPSFLLCTLAPKR